MKVWTRDVLSELVRTKLDAYRLIAVSKREPFQHWRVRNQIERAQPASGMASALDPVLRACGGLWIAHRAALQMQMHADERRRMVRLREMVEQNNVYRWADKCISELAKLKSPQHGHRQYPVALPQRAVNQPKFRLAPLGVAV